MMKKTKTIFILVLAALLLVVSMSIAQQLKKHGRYYIADIEKEFKVAPGGILEIKDVRGDVQITSWSKNVVYIHERRKMDVYTKEEAEAVLKDQKYQYQKIGNKIVVGMKGSYRSYMSSYFDVKLPKKFNATVSTAGGDLRVSDLEGEVKLVTSGGDIDVSKIDGIVKATTSGGDISANKISKEAILTTSGGDIDMDDIKGDVKAATAGGDLSLREIAGNVRASTSGGDIIVEKNTGNVSVQTSGGDIELYDVGAQVKATTSGGDVVVRRSSGDVKVVTSGGDIDLTDIQGKISATTSGGDIEATTVMKGIKVTTAGGNIELVDIRGFIDAKTSGGDMKAELTLQDFSKDHHVTMNTASGDIELRIPAQLPATIKARLKVTPRARDDYDIISDFPISIKKEKEGRNEIISATGEINGGGDVIELKTTNGNISIIKAK
ncbi:hypothetical protein B6D60_00195 [candidate division KSB1 bacterium 4484_87]|nr:MAG: hypothetical protein B6D60_00195 [candidate division KSB1 bacterium 4484_87]